MAKKRTQAYNPNPKKTPDEKSRTVSLKLAPGSHYRTNFERWERNEGLSARVIFERLMDHYLQTEGNAPPSVIMPQTDYTELVNSMRWLIEQVQSGGLIAAAGTATTKQTKRGKKAAEVPEQVLNVFNRFMSFSGGDGGEDS